MHFHISRIFWNTLSTAFIFYHNFVNFCDLFVYIILATNIWRRRFTQLFEHCKLIFFYNIDTLAEVLYNLPIMPLFNLCQTQLPIQLLSWIFRLRRLFDNLNSTSLLCNLHLSWSFHAIRKLIFVCESWAVRTFRDRIHRYRVIGGVTADGFDVVGRG